MGKRLKVQFVVYAGKRRNSKFLGIRVYASRRKCADWRGNADKLPGLRVELLIANLQRQDPSLASPISSGRFRKTRSRCTQTGDLENHAETTLAGTRN